MLKRTESKMSILFFLQQMKVLTCRKCVGRRDCPLLRGGHPTIRYPLPCKQLLPDLLWPSAPHSAWSPCPPQVFGLRPTLSLNP